MAQVSATMTDQTPVTADGVVPPHSGLREEAEVEPRQDDQATGPD